MDEKDIQTEQVSTETASPSGDTQEKPLTREEILSLISQATETAKREIQSVKDKARNEVEVAQRRARSSEGALEAIKGSYADLEPEVQATLRLRELEAKDRLYSQRDGMEMQRLQQERFDQSFVSQLSQTITDLGIDPNDSRIDWGQEFRNQGDYLKAQDKILKSVTKIQKENSKVVEEKKSTEIKDLEAKLRKDLGLDEVPTSTPTGASKGIPTDMAKFKKWVNTLPIKEYQEKKKDIDDMLSKGLIK